MDMYTIIHRFVKLTECKNCIEILEVRRCGKMKIIHVISSLGTGGRERRMVQLVKSFNYEDKVSQTIVTLHKDGDYKNDVPENVNTLDINSRSRYGFSKKIIRILFKEHPDIIHLWADTPLLVILICLFKSVLRYKVIAGFVADGNIVKSKLQRKINKLVFRFADAIISNSKAGLVAKRAPLDKSYVIYNGFDFKRFVPFDRHALKQSLGLGDGCIVMMAARMSPSKDWKMFIEVAYNIQNLKKGIQFLAVGAGEDFEKLVSYAKKRGVNNIKFLGRRNDVEKLLQISDVSLLFSDERHHAEGVSNSIMESMAAGVPVIATRGGGTSEIIDDEINGYIVNPGDMHSASQKILNLINDTKELDLFSQRSIDTINQKFLLSDMKKKYMSVYDKLLNSK